MGLQIPLHRHGFSLAIIGLLLAVSWFFLLWAIAHMDSRLTQAMMPMKSTWTLQQAFMVWLMWAVMMAAMMLPSAVPVILLHRTMTGQKSDQANSANLLFISAYLIVWSGFSIAGSGVQWLFQHLSVLSHMLVITEGWLASAVMILAGCYQFSSLKDVCLVKCRSPLAFFLGHWRPGLGGAIRMGLIHGAYCVGCCWALMCVLFVFGVMNIAAIFALASMVVAEKLVPYPHILRRGFGAILIGWGLFIQVA